MSTLDLLLLLIGLPAGLVVTVCAIGVWATVGCRLEHKREMFKLAEQAKVTSITIQERQMTMLDSQRRLG